MPWCDHESVPMGSQEILVVDDDWNVGQVIAFLLADHGYASRYASNGSIALELLAKAAADLVLMDLMMPIVDGPELLRQMRATDEFALTPVLVMSEGPEHIARRECPRATAFLRKPFTSAELLDAVRAILG